MIVDYRTQQEIDFNEAGIRSNIINDIPEQFIDDGMVDSVFLDLPHGDELEADFDKFCRENQE